MPLLPGHGTAAVIRFAHAPHGTLSGAETAGGVDLRARTVEVYLNIEAVFAARVAEAVDGGNLKFIDARAQFVVAGVTDDVTAFSDQHVGIAIAPAAEIDAHFPGADTLPFDDWIR